MTLSGIYCITFLHCLDIKPLSLTLGHIFFITEDILMKCHKHMYHNFTICSKHLGLGWQIVVYSNKAIVTLFFIYSITYDSGMRDSLSDFFPINKWGSWHTCLSNIFWLNMIIFHKPFLCLCLITYICVFITFDQQPIILKMIH